MSLQNITDEQFEKCVCGCKGPTDVRRDTYIENRLNYVEGIGQLLPECYERIYGPSLIEEVRAKLWLQDIGIVL